jgi:hypothetical protein
MLKTVQGIYRNGKIELAEIPDNIIESEVLITFIDTLNTEKISVQSSTAELFYPLRGKIKYFEDITTPTTEEWGEI